MTDLTRVCNICSGSGTLLDGQGIDYVCSKCNGTGKETRPATESDLVECDVHDCINGVVGHTTHSYCHKCNGLGKVLNDKLLQEGWKIANYR